MAFITADRVTDTSLTTGAGNITLAAAPPIGYRSFSSVLAVSDTFYYCIQSQSTGEWETGVGTYVSVNTFARTTVIASSNSNTLVSFSSGTKTVFLTLSATQTLQTAPGTVGASAIDVLSTSSTTARSLAARFSDVKNVLDYGADPTGITDSTSAINAAVASLGTAGGYVFFPAGTFKVSSTITIGNGTPTTASTINNVFLVGSGTTGPFGATNIGTTILWAGASSSTTPIIKFLGAMNGGGLLGSWILDGAGAAGRGLFVNHLQGGQFDSLKIKRCTSIYLLLYTQTVPDPVGGCRNNRFGLFSTDTIPSGATGIVLDGITTIHGNILQNTFDIVDLPISGTGATGIYLGYADFNRFNVVDISAQSTLTTSTGIQFYGSGPSGNAIFPSMNFFGQVASDGPLNSNTSAGTPYGNYIEIWDVADSQNIIPSAAGVFGMAVSTNVSGTQRQTIPFGYRGPGWNSTTPSIPALNVAVVNNNPYSVMIYFVPSVGVGITGIVLTDTHGTDNTLPGVQVSVLLEPSGSIKFTSVVPASWIWYGMTV